MGCGSSGQVVTPENANGAGGKMAYGNGGNINGANGANGANGTNGTNEANGTNGTNGTNGFNSHNDDLPTMVLPETPVKPKPPIAYEIPIEEFDGARRPSTPPAHLQRLLQPTTAEISLPDIEEKLAVAEQRRIMILQQRAASAQKRAQRMVKSLSETDRMNNGQIPEDGKHPNLVTISPESGVCESKNI